jgi:uncharacterized membrane protein YbaN (DUF454 family)
MRPRKRDALCLVGVLATAVGLVAVVLLNTDATGPNVLLTSGQLDKAVPGCKWWYCAQPAGLFPYLSDWDSGVSLLFILLRFRRLS